MIKAVIFDMDGLMVDTEMISCICYREILESYGFSFTKEDYIKDYPGRTLMTSLQFIKDKYHIDDDIHEMADRFHDLEDQYVQTHYSILSVQRIVLCMVQFHCYIQCIIFE